MAQVYHTPAHQDVEDHLETYRAFIRGSVAVVMLCAYILVALVSVTFGSSHPVFWGLAGLIFGSIVIAVDLRTGAKWYLSTGLLVLFGLFTAYNVAG